jgi:hypothetical protein
MKEPRLKRNLGPAKAGSKLYSKHRRSPREELDEFYRNRPVKWMKRGMVPSGVTVEGVVPGCDPFAQKNPAAEPVMIWWAGNL